MWEEWESRREVQVRRWWGRRRGKVVAEQCEVCEAAASFPSQMSRGHLGTGTPRWERVANQAFKTGDVLGQRWLGMVVV